MATVSGTGHRPDKIGGYSDEVHEKLVELAIGFLRSHPEIDRVIAGGALGWDTALAEAAIRLKLHLTLALPFPGFEDRWPAKSKARLYAHMAQAYGGFVFVCEPGYAGWKMQERNKWMVDRADVILALWDGSAGGTSNCLNYANKRKVAILNLWPEWDN